MRVLLLLFLFSSVSARADEAVERSEAGAGVLANLARDGWGGKSDNELKSTLDAKGRTNGYELESEWNLFRRNRQGWGPLLGIDVKADETTDLDYGSGVPAPSRKKRSTAGEARVTKHQYVDYYYAGVRAALRPFGRPLSLDLVYNRLAQADRQAATGHDGFVTFDLRSKAALSGWGRLKLRLRYLEYLRLRSGPGVDTRQTRLEASPAAVLGAWSAGFRNRITHRFRTSGSGYYADTAPFVRYELRHLVVTLKTVFTPLASGDGRTFAEAWLSHPTYSADLTLSL